MAKRKQQYSAEFKQDAVDYYHSSGKSLEQVAGDLKVSKSALSKWVTSTKTTNDSTVNHRGSGNYSSDAEQEIARLKKELKDSNWRLTVRCERFAARRCTGYRWPTEQNHRMLCLLYPFSLNPALDADSVRMRLFWFV